MTRDQVSIVLIAGSWSLGVGVLGAIVWWWLRRAPVRWSAGLVAAVATLGVVAGVVGTAQAMFLSTHDLAVVVLVCAVSGVVSLVFALVLARALARSAQRLRRMAAGLGAGEPVTPTGADPREFRAVGDELVHSGELLRAAQARERQLEQSRRELVAWVSHDLRTPLAGLRAMAEALDDGLATEPARYHHQMLMEVDRMAAMVDDLFELSQIHAGTLSLSVESVALRDVVSESIAGATPVAAVKGVVIGGQVPSDVEVQADPAALSRVVGNLVMNAIRHTPADGVVLVEGRHDGEEVELTVSDACGGIDPDELARVFEVAWRGNSARTPEDGVGGGLGLAIVRGLVEAQRGTVLVRNHADGCRFIVRLPA